MPVKGSPDLFRLLTALVVFVGMTSLTLGLRHLAFRTLHRWGLRTGSVVDSVIFKSLRIPSIAWCILIGLYSALDQAHLPPRPSALALNIVYGLLVLSVTAAVANLSTAALSHTMTERHLPIPATGLSYTIFKATIWTLGGLVLLGSLGVSITPILTALGVGGIAVALALQETLSNFFAGLHLLISQPFRVGDFVKLETGQEGRVVDIGWRSTKLQMPPNNIIIVPNSKMAQSIVINYSMPDPRMAVSIQIGVSYASDPDVVERVLLEETLKTAGQAPGLLTDPAPSVRFVPGFGDSSLDFTLTCHVRGFEDQVPVQHELRKRILKRFRKEGIEIPFPHRIVHLKTADAQATPGSEKPSPGHTAPPKVVP
ncbi:MAG: mechanosensitive ion channel family protein [Nitrospirae bacterium]|nr:mechanosensitive ion channel family protein [Nitrospirota bacterium]